MTILETERLIRKLSELLAEGGNSDIAPKFAGDYAAACHAVNLRLLQCEAMVKAGERHQAIQLAETAPNLLDLVTVLEFRSADDWRAFCHQNALPVPERIDARSVQALNSCYAEGITTDHPLYASYRKAVLNRNDEEALKALQSITRLNPSDGNATSELARLDAKVLSARLNHLGGLLAGGDTGVVVAAIDAIEAFGFKTQPQGDEWSKAAIVRCGFLLEQAATLKGASQWVETLAKLDFIRRIQSDLKLELPTQALKELESLEAWARGEQQKDRKNREFAALLSQLHHRIELSEDKDTSARYVKLPELRDDFEALHKVWRSLADFTRPIPESATAAFRKRSALLESEIARRTAIRRRAIVATTAAALLVGGAIVWFVLGQMKSSEFARQLQTAVSQRQLRSAEHLLERVRTSERGLLGAGAVNAAVGAAESFAAKEHGLLSNFESSFAKLPTQLAGAPDAPRINAIAEDLAQSRIALNSLAPDVKAENEPRVAAFEKKWRQFLDDTSVTVSGTFEQMVNKAEEQCRQLDYRTPIETAAQQICTLSGVIQQISACEAGFTNHVSLRADLLQRAVAARAKFVAYEHEFKKLEEGLTGLQKAHAFSDFSQAIALVASSEFSAAPAVVAASSIQSLGITEEGALRNLLSATNAGTWAFITRSTGLSLVPEIAMPAERAMLQTLSTDPAVNASHQRYRLWLDAEGTKTVEWITAGSLDDSQGWKKIRAWSRDVSPDSAVFDDMQYGYFDGQCKLSPTQPVYRVVQGETLKEASIFSSVGVEKVWPGGSTYGKPALEVLDAIKESADGSPVFRAYLFIKLVELMEFQPDAWGLSFCPSARSLASRIRNAVGGQIASGDWFVQSRANAWSEKLNQLFAANKSLSYAKQATANFALAQSVAKDGLRYVGFVDLNGKAVLVDNGVPAEVWAYDAARKQPTQMLDSTMLLSPLFALPAPRADYLTKAGLNADVNRFTDALPPLFRTATKP